MANTSDIKNGLCMNYNGKIVTVVEFQHVKPGKGPAFVRTKLRYIETGKVVDNTFSAGHKIDVVRVETRNYQFLYAEGNGFHFMNNETYEQIFVNGSLIENPQFLKEGATCILVFHADEEQVLTVELPFYIDTVVTYTEPGLKGDTATNTMKPATIDTGAEIKVPLFIDIGDKIRVDTRKGEYSERIK
jgi:elongation factor P